MNYVFYLIPKHIDTWYVPCGTYMCERKMCPAFFAIHVTAKIEKMAGQTGWKWGIKPCPSAESDCQSVLLDLFIFFYSEKTITCAIHYRLTHTVRYSHVHINVSFWLWGIFCLQLSCCKQKSKHTIITSREKK